jgi:hypothetical protein
LSLVTNLVPGGECGLEGGEGAAGDGVGGVLREERDDETVEDGGRERLNRGVFFRLAASEAEDAEGRELLGEAMEGEEGVADDEALLRGGGGMGGIGFRRTVAPRRRGRGLPLELAGHRVLDWAAFGFQGAVRG